MRKKIPYGTKLPVFFTGQECDLVREHTFYDPEFAPGIKSDAKKVQINMDLDDIEDLQGYVAAEANHTPDKKLQKKLDMLFQKLQKFLDTYDDQGDM